MFTKRFPIRILNEIIKRRALISCLPLNKVKVRYAKDHHRLKLLDLGQLSEKSLESKSLTSLSTLESKIKFLNFS